MSKSAASSVPALGFFVFIDLSHPPYGGIRVPPVSTNMTNHR
jgi:hypothetical protein